MWTIHHPGEFSLVLFGTAISDPGEYAGLEPISLVYRGMTLTRCAGTRLDTCP